MRLSTVRTHVRAHICTAASQVSFKVCKSTAVCWRICRNKTYLRASPLFNLHPMQTSKHPAQAQEHLGGMLKCSRLAQEQNWLAKCRAHSQCTAEDQHARAMCRRQEQKHITQLLQPCDIRSAWRKLGPHDGLKKVLPSSAFWKMEASNGNAN